MKMLMMMLLMLMMKKLVIMIAALGASVAFATAGGAVGRDARGAERVEALAAGRILLTFGTAGVSEYLQPTNPHGIVVWPPTAASMAATLLEIVDAPETARAMGRAAEKYVVAEGLIRDRTIDRAVQFYHEISEKNAAD